MSHKYLVGYKYLDGPDITLAGNLALVLHRILYFISGLIFSPSPIVLLYI